MKEVLYQRIYRHGNGQKGECKSVNKVKDPSEARLETVDMGAFRLFRTACKCESGEYLMQNIPFFMYEPCRSLDQKGPEVHTRRKVRLKAPATALL